MPEGPVDDVPRSGEPGKDGGEPVVSLADPHCHTVASDGMVSPAELVAAARAAGLALIAVTDHDTMAATREAWERGQEIGVAVVRGQEITTRWPAQTHVVGWFLERPIRSGMSLGDTIDAIHDQGGLAVIPHPFMPTYFASCQPGMLARLIERHPVDAIEVLHTAPMSAGRRRLLAAFYQANRERLGAAVGASDSHFGRHDLGGMVTEFDGLTAEDFRAAVLGRRTRPRVGGRATVPLGLALRQQWRSLVDLPLRRLRHRLP
ncbi:MAG TPA: PHP domain-containing protein [Candidatus Dormibacteraeota bacterium]|nr:PHP domain-containing protein [Candidatus Dormibacteraeota bacterium]